MLSLVKFSDLAEQELHIQLYLYRVSYSEQAHEKQIAIRKTYKRQLIRNWLSRNFPEATICAAQSRTGAALQVSVNPEGLTLTPFAHEILCQDVIDRFEQDFRPASR